MAVIGGQIRPSNITVAGYRGAPAYVDVSTVTTPGVEQTLITFVVAASTVTWLHNFYLVCRQESTFNVFINSTKIGSGRTGPASPNVHFNWFPNRQAVFGDTIEVKFTARTSSPVVSAEAYLQASTEAI